VCGMAGRTHAYYTTSTVERRNALSAVTGRGGVLLTTYGMVLHNTAALVEGAGRLTRGEGGESGGGKGSQLEHSEQNFAIHHHQMHMERGEEEGRVTAGASWSTCRLFVACLVLLPGAVACCWPFLTPAAGPCCLQMLTWRTMRRVWRSGRRRRGSSSSRAAAAAAAVVRGASLASRSAACCGTTSFWMKVCMCVRRGGAKSWCGGVGMWVCVWVGGCERWVV
jgi:hypothetical protein